MRLLGPRILMWDRESIPAFLFQMGLVFTAWFMCVISNCLYDALFRAGTGLQTVGVMDSGSGRPLPLLSPAPHLWAQGSSFLCPWGRIRYWPLTVAEQEGSAVREWCNEL